MSDSCTGVSLSEFAAVIGIDWADAQHDVCLVDLSSGRRESRNLLQEPAAIEAWALGLRERYPGRKLAIAVELSRGPLIYALLKFCDFLTLVPVNPQTLSCFRKAFSPSGAKDDPTDAALLADLLLKHSDKLRAWRPESESIRRLRLLCEDRRDAVDKRTEFVNELTAVLKAYYPQAFDLTGDSLVTPLALDFLAAWPCLEAAQAAKPHKLRGFYIKHGSRRPEVIEQRLAGLAQARPLTTDSAVIDVSMRKLKLLVQLLRDMQKAIADYETQIDELMQHLPDAEIFSGLPGAGDALAPRLLAAFGDDRERFQSAAEMQTLCGVAPVTKRSGRTRIVHRRWACPKFLLQTFHEFATHSLGRSTWARAYYDQLRQKNKPHHTAIRALAFKWIRVLFRCWHDRTAYDEARYLADLKKHNVPWAINLALI